MWASIEKWAYPQWSLPLLETHPRLTMGFDASIYMTLAGFVEFGLAFALIWTPLVRRLAALMLTGMFVSAVLEFGKVDAIGHLLIVAILLTIAADDEPRLARSPILAPAVYCAALIGFISVYYGSHVLLFKPVAMQAGLG